MPTNSFQTPCPFDPIKSPAVECRLTSFFSFLKNISLFYWHKADWYRRLERLLFATNAAGTLILFSCKIGEEEQEADEENERENKNHFFPFAPG